MKVKRKSAYSRRPRNFAYMLWVKSLPCTVSSMDCNGPVEAAHVGDRGLSRKSNDEETIPLCSGHHRLNRKALHNMGRLFFEHHRIDKIQLVLDLNKKWEAMKDAQA